MKNKSLVGIAAIYINDDISWTFRIAYIASTFSAEAVAITGSEPHAHREEGDLINLSIF
jgi:hypothetical protein